MESDTPERGLGSADVEGEAVVAGPSYREGIYEALALLHGEWVVAVLASLATRPLTYSSLRQEINEAEERSGWASHAHPVSQKVLSATLLRMRRDGLITRTPRSGSGSTFAPVWYELTPLGRSFLRSLRSVAKWAKDNQAAVERARARYGEESPDES